MKERNTPSMDGISTKSEICDDIQSNTHPLQMRDEKEEEEKKLDRWSIILSMAWWYSVACDNLLPLK